METTPVKAASAARIHSGAREKHLAFWGMLIWWVYILFKILGYVLGVAVPFGLAALVYLPQVHQGTINLILIGASFAALTIQAVLDALRFRDRAMVVRAAHAQLSIGNLKYDTGVIKDSELIEIVNSAEQRLLTREAP